MAKALENIIDIIRGCMMHDHKYQRVLYDRYRGFALKIVFRYIYVYEKAMDVTNDGFIRLFNHFSSFRCDDGTDNAEKMLMGLIKRIMINASIDELRKNRMLPEIGRIPDHVWDIPDKSQDADQMMLYKDLIIIIKRLPPQYRIVFNMYVIDGYSHCEIASMLKMSEGTSKSTLSRARTLLQKFIKEQENINVCSL
jgi:RNA polymerase sigma factor (sigma-70 family)